MIFCAWKKAHKQNDCLSNGAFFSLCQFRLTWHDNKREQYAMIARVIERQPKHLDGIKCGRLSFHSVWPAPSRRQIALLNICVNEYNIYLEIWSHCGCVIVVIALSCWTFKWNFRCSCGCRRTENQVAGCLCIGRYNYHLSKLIIPRNWRGIRRESKFNYWLACGLILSVSWKTRSTTSACVQTEKCVFSFLFVYRLSKHISSKRSTFTWKCWRTMALCFGWYLLGVESVFVNYAFFMRFRCSVDCTQNKRESEKNNYRDI